MLNTYSFEDVTVAFSSPTVGNFASTGAGIGTIAIDMTTEKTVQEVAADGTVMVSKILGENGTVVLSVQQTSQLQKLLLNWYRYANSVLNPLSAWTDMIVTISSVNLGETTTCTGVSPQKLPGHQYQAQGQLISWTLMCANIVQTNTGNNGN
jgi:hypothetical protein